MDTGTAIALAGGLYLYMRNEERQTQQQVRSGDTITVTRAQVDMAQREYDRRIHALYQQEWNKRERELREEIEPQYQQEKRSPREIFEDSERMLQEQARRMYAK